MSVVLIAVVVGACGPASEAVAPTQSAVAGSIEPSTAPPSVPAVSQVAGGGTTRTNWEEGTTMRSAEIYDPASDTWARTDDLAAPRKDGHAVRLADGTVLVLGGDDRYNVDGDTPLCAPPLTTVERFDPAV